jgi:hypothetical protein
LLSPLQTPESTRTAPFGSASSQVHGPAPLPTPPQPVYTGVSRPGPYYADYNDLPSTERSYGNTSHLLDITPGAAVERQPNVSPLRCHPATCVGPAHVSIYEDPEPATPVTPSVKYYHHDNKENIPPDDDYSPGLAALGMHGDHEWSPFRKRHDEYGDLGRAMPRSSSIYPDDGQSAWITEADTSHINLGDMQRFSHISASSYANTSFVESEHRFSFQSPYAPAPLSLVRDSPPAPPAVSVPVGAKFFGNIKNIADRRNRQIEARIDHLESKIAEEQIASGYTGSPQIDASQRRAELAEIDHLRKLLPASHQPFVFKTKESTETAKLNPPSKLQKARNFARAQYQPKTNCSRTLALGQHDSAFNSGSDTRGLLASPITPAPYTNLGYSESTGTFMTVQQESPFDIRGPATNLWSPFDKNPTTRAIHVQSPPGKKPPCGDIDIELGLMGGTSSRSHRAAIGSQYEPRELQLVKNKRLTDAQLVAHSAHWTTMPSGRDIAADYAGAFSPNHFMLGSPETFMDCVTLREQKRISKRYAYPCLIFPPLSLAFGLGAFDRSIAKRTDGRVTKACPKVKHQALFVGFPLGMIFWGVFIISVYLMISFMMPSKENGSPIS